MEIASCVTENQTIDPKSSEKSKEFRNIGNDYYKKSHYYEALKFYNKSLCYAETSEDISLAYGNRSAVYFELKVYQHCLHNILLALPNYPKDKVAKLIERQEKCRQKPSEDTLVTKSLLEAFRNCLKPSYPTNPKNPNIVECLELKSDPVFGRGIYTTCDLNPGDMIANEDIHFGYIMDAPYERCFICMNTLYLNLVPSSINTYSMYCSFGCMTLGNALFMFHGPQPGNLEKIKTCDLGYPLQLLLIPNNTYNENLKTVFDYDWKSLSLIEHNKASLECFYGLQGVIADTPYFNVQLASILMANKLPFNFYDVRSDGKLTADHSMHHLLFGSLFNHSCDPNVMRINLIGKIIFYVVKPIKKGEQLFILYPSDSSFSAEKTERRREILIKEFYFDCQCTACKLDYSLTAETEFSKPKNVKDMRFKEVFEEFKENNKALKNDFEDYRDEKAQYLIQRNVRLMHFISAYTILPFND